MGHRFTPQRKHANVLRELLRAVRWAAVWLVVTVVAVALAVWQWWHR